MQGISVTSSLLYSDILLWTSFSDTINLCLSFAATNRITDVYKGLMFLQHMHDFQLLPQSR